MDELGTGGSAAAGSSPGSPIRGRTVLQSFDYDGVRLLPGRFCRQVEQARAVYGSVPTDDILKGFRQAAGHAAPGEGLRGWCRETSSVIFGQLLSGLVRLGRAARDEALIAKARALFAGWRETLAADGNTRMRLYDWEKLVCGLVDLHAYAGVPEALPTLAQTARWASRTFDRSRQPADRHDFWGAGPGDTSEWYTLPENLYRAYLLSADPLFRDFADLWLYEDYWRPFAEGVEPPDVLPVHAYSHVNSFSSAAMAYAVKGEERYRRICVNAFDFLQRTQCYATGGFGPDERLMPPDGSLGRSLELMAYHAEIPCGSWAAFKLSRYLMTFTGEARFGDWIETLLYNGMGAALPTEPNGRTYYYGDYRLSAGTKQFYWHEWPCCSGTYLQNVAEYHNLVFFRDPGAIYVNLYIPAEVAFLHEGANVRLTLETDYPEADTATVRLSLEAPARFTLRFRIPGWANGASIALNGSPLRIGAEPGRWASVEREWQSEDRVTITIPMSLRAVPVDAHHPDRVALMYGPVVLAQDEACCRRPLSLAPATSLTTRLVREGPGLRFRITNTMPERHTRFLQPLYDFPAHWPYWVYFDLHARPLY